jgi:hypothetical protein
MATQLNNIAAKTGKSLDELTSLIRESGLSKHSANRELLMRELGLGYGDANTLVHYALKTDGTSAAADLSTDGVLDGIYSGPKAHMRPIHEAFLAAIDAWGDYEVVPKKGYVSLRRKKQFAMLGPATNTRFEVGLNMKGVPGTERLVEQPAGGMCNYKVKLTDPGEVDGELLAWTRQAFDAAG